jgi:ABC-type multidrug transport system ATPase subunit
MHGLSILRPLFAFLCFVLVIVVAHAFYECPPGLDCVGEQVCSKEAEACSRGFYCPGYSIVDGKAVGSLPSPCPSKYYCPTPAEKIECPSGHFCPERTHSPHKCLLTAYCPHKSEYQFFYLPIVVTLIIPFIVWGIFKALRVGQQPRKDVSRTSVVGPSSEEEKQPILGPTHTSINARRDGRRAISVHDRTFLRKNNLEVDIILRGVEVDDTHGRKILSDVNACFRVGRVCAVMGPPSEGTEALLMILAGKLPPTRGSVCAVSHGVRIPLYRKKGVTDLYRKNVGYVPAANIVHRTLTTDEILTFSARLRLPKEWSQQRRKQVVSTVIDILGLQSVCHTIIGDENRRGISGGQVKRANIGMEFVTLPNVLILNDATAGLDGSFAQDVVATLVKTAQVGATVVSSLTQPRHEIFELLDDVFFISRSGKQVFSGPRSQVEAYFASTGFPCPPKTNPADFFVDVVSGMITPSSPMPEGTSSAADLPEIWTAKHKDVMGVDDMEDLYGDEAENDDGDDLNPYHKISQKMCRVGLRSFSTVRAVREAKDTFIFVPGASFLDQLMLFLKRSLMLKYRNMSAVAVGVLLHLIAGLVIGYSYSASRGNMLYHPAIDRNLADTKCPLIIRDRCQNEPLDHKFLMTLMFFLNVAVTGAGVCGSIETFDCEKDTFKREHSSGFVQNLPFFLAKNIVDIPFMFFNSMVFMSIFYFLVFPRGAFMDYFWIVFLVELGAYGLGYIISMVSRRENATVVGVVLAMALSIGSGGHPKLRDVKWPFRFFWATNFIRYSGEAIYITEVEPYKDIATISGGFHVLGLKEGNYGIDILMMTVLSVGLRMIAFLCLRAMTKRN